MRYHDGGLIFAPTDLSRWASSPYASWMARYTVENPEAAPARDEPDAMLARLALRGLRHEDGLEATFRERGLEVHNVDKAVEGAAANERLDQAIALTRELLQAGTDVIAQAALAHDGFAAYADFLVKVPGTSALGDFHYEVWDTKLARRVKPGMVLQLCCYVDMLDALQSRRADDLVVALGDGTHERVRVADCFDYYRAIKRAFTASQASWSREAEPDPAEFADHGDWAGYANGLLEARDHLSRVARISRRQIERLNAVGIQTMSALADASGTKVPGINAALMERLVRQAALQCRSATSERPAFEVLTPSADVTTGLAALPPASPLDVFFDIEGFPLESDGLEYLWGCTHVDGTGERCFEDWWAHDEAAERRAFESFIDWVYARWQADPTMHVYHYAPYETTACKRLMGKYGTRERELDELLRRHVFVDLYAIVTHGVLIGEPRYSIKNVERVYRPGRTTDVASGADSVVVYDLWREAHQRGEDGGGWQTSEVLQSLREYNRDDCDSTLELCEWLRGLSDVPPPIVASEAPVEAELSEVVTDRHALRDRLLSRAEALEQNDPHRRLFETLAGVLEFHRREDKQAWWRYFDRMDEANDGLADDAACVADCRRTEREGFKRTPQTRNLAWEYAFDPNQELKGLSGSVYLKGAELVDGFAPRAKVLHDESDLDAGRVVVQCKDEPPAQISLVPNELVRADPIPEAIDAVVAEIADGRVTRSALLDCLTRSPPRFKDRSGGPVIRSATTALEDTVDAVRSLDESCLIIQGPPGAGKTYTAARIIAALMADGCRVGIASNSHKAIDNLMLATARHCHEHGIDGHFVRSKRTSDALDALGVEIRENGKLTETLRDACVVGTTAWGFARADLAGAFDVLLIDEAGQVALANLIAMSRSARNLVILGDQRQLGQPTQGSHPADSGLSVLDYRLGDTAAVDPAHGVFLGTTYRMHPAINALVSRLLYDGRLDTAPVTSTRTLRSTGQGDALDREAGIVFLPVAHVGNDQASDEEVAAIVASVDTLLGRRLRDEHGAERQVTLADMLFVAPYNAQVARLQQALGQSARVGSVDRFQGQEAPIVFLSLCASDASAAPRGLGFLFNRNRLNVAVSRAQTRCVVVGHPGLATTPVATLEDLKRVNFVAALALGEESIGPTRGFSSNSEPNLR